MKNCWFHVFFFSVLFSGRPFALQNCSVSNQSSDSLQVECEPGFDGGLPQQFLLELVEMPALRLARNLSLQVSKDLWYTHTTSLQHNCVCVCVYIICCDCVKFSSTLQPITQLQSLSNCMVLFAHSNVRCSLMLHQMALKMDKSLGSKN